MCFQHSCNSLVHPFADGIQLNVLFVVGTNLCSTVMKVFGRKKTVYSPHSHG